MFNSMKKGFTLIETLITIGLIAFLASIVIIAINPARQFAQARNAKRRADVVTILDAIYENMAENGEWSCPVAIPTTTSTIASSGGVDLCDCLVPTYVAEMPYDPSTGSYTDCDNYDTKYQIVKSSANRITVSAPDAELGETISVTR